MERRRNGMHVLRHTYASVLLGAGESVFADDPETPDGLITMFGVSGH